MLTWVKPKKESKRAAELKRMREDFKRQRKEEIERMKEEREMMAKIVKFFTHGEMYRKRGVKIPGCILLCGPPRVGKTLLAKAVAGEAGVNFFSISASQFVEIYVGVGASRVRTLHPEARENVPSAVFIGELDAVGRERGLIKGFGGQERDCLCLIASEDLKHKVFEVSLADLQGDEDNAHRKIRLRSIWW